MITFDSDVAIDSVSLEEMLAAGGASAVTIGKTGKGLVVVSWIAKKNRILGQYHGGPRYFLPLGDAGSVFIQHGIHQWETDADGWVPRTLTRIGKRTNGGMTSAAG